MQVWYREENMFDIKNYKEALYVKDAMTYLREEPDSIIIAGGTDVLIKIREGKLAGSSLIGIHKINELKGICKDANGDIHIGPLVCFTQLEEDEIIKENLEFLGKAGGTMGGPQLRNIATIGGNVCNGATSADSGSMLVCLNAKLKLSYLDNVRMVPISEFYKGPGKVDLMDGELLTDIIIKREDYEGFTGKYIKFSQRRAMDIATIGCSVMLKQEDGIITDLRLGYGVAAPTPVRCPGAEEFAIGKEATEESAKAIGEKALEDVNPRDSWRGSRAFRQQLIKELGRKAIEQLIGLGGGQDA
jgi:xanthine dehydrogenase FAD-binding subunit